MTREETNLYTRADFQNNLLALDNTLNKIMSSKISGRNFLGITLANERRSSDVEINGPISSEDIKAEKHLLDENSNTVVDPVDDIEGTDVLELTTTEIQEKKVKKKSSAMNSFRNFVKGTVVVSSTNDKTPNSPTTSSKNAAATTKGDKIDMSNENTEDKDNTKFSRKKRLSFRKKRVRRSRAITNEGLSLWTPLEGCRWKSVTGRTVALKTIKIYQLCDAELAALKQLGLTLLQEKKMGVPISIPKEYPSAARRRWKQVLQKRQKTKSDSSGKESPPKPEYPVFSIDLAQAIENEKSIEETAKNEPKILQEVPDVEIKIEENNNENNRHRYSPRRNSDLFVKVNSVSSLDTECLADTSTEYMISALRTFDTLQEEDEEESSYNKRKSRLIEALQLSSVTATSVCILDKDTEFCPPEPKVPNVLVQAVDFISKNALNTVGIFRTGGSKKRVRQSENKLVGCHVLLQGPYKSPNDMKEDFNFGKKDVINNDSNPHDVAALFKEFLRCLPDPLLTRELYCAFMKSGQFLYQDLILEVIRWLVWLLPTANRDTLELSLGCLKSVADNSQDRFDDDGNISCRKNGLIRKIFGNKMDSQNLATLIAPNILHQCKAYKMQTPYAVATDANTEDNKAAIDIVYTMIEHNEALFEISAKEHDEVLKLLLESDPETVDYVLKKKTPTISLSNESGKRDAEYCEKEINLQRKRPSSVGSRSRFSFEEVSFSKSHSFNNGPYKPFVRRRKESSASAGSRPGSVRSDPADRSSFRKSGTCVSPNLRKRKTSKVFADIEQTEKNLSRNSSPRDSGVVVNPSPTFQRNSLRKSFNMNEMTTTLKCNDSPKGRNKYSPLGSPAIIKRKTNIRSRNYDRDSMDSGLFSNRTSAANSIHVQDIENENDLSPPPVFVDETLLSPESPRQRKVHVSPNSSTKRKSGVRRKMSLPTFGTTEKLEKEEIVTSPSSETLSGVITRTTPNIKWDDESEWPEWKLNIRVSQFPDQETTL